MTIFSLPLTIQIFNKNAMVQSEKNILNKICEWEKIQTFLGRCSGRLWGRGAGWSVLQRTSLNKSKMEIPAKMKKKNYFLTNLRLDILKHWKVYNTRHEPMAHPRTILAIQGCECSTAFFPPMILKPSSSYCWKVWVSLFHTFIPFIPPQLFRREI